MRQDWWTEKPLCGCVLCRDGLQHPVSPVAVGDCPLCPTTEQQSMEELLTGSVISSPLTCWTACLMDTPCSSKWTIMYSISDHNVASSRWHVLINVKSLLTLLMQLWKECLLYVLSFRGAFLRTCILNSFPFFRQAFLMKCRNYKSSNKTTLTRIKNNVILGYTPRYVLLSFCDSLLTY